MGWLQRGKGRYYYRRRNGKSEYIGRGQTAELAAERDEARRSLRTQELADRQLQRRQFLLAEGALRNFTDLASLVGRAMLIAAGYHQHDRGEWRRRRTAAIERDGQ